MIHAHTFHRNQFSLRWYIDLPDFLAQGLGTVADLEMVAGADTLLDLLAQGENKVAVSFTEEALPGYLVLTRIRETPDFGGGALYQFRSYLGNLTDPSEGAQVQEFEVWLCDVTRYVFGGYLPEVIYFTPS
jgi:hypothetical protein